jgi:poly(3-hydroxyalkanoate) depolymerase
MDGTAHSSEDGHPAGEEFVRVGDLLLRVARRGAGPPLLLINGIGAPIEMWQPLARRLDGHEVIMFDLPGSGRSRAPAVPLRMPGFARVAAGLLDALGHARVDVLGYSFGGLVAQELSRLAPARVRRLVLCATAAGVPSLPPHPLTLMLMLTPARYYTRSLGAWIVPRIAGGRTARDARALRRDLDYRQANPPSVVGYAQQLFAATGWSSQLWLHQLRQRTLVLHGDDDPLVPLANARWMSQRLPNSRLHVLEGAGHLFLVDEPGRIVGTIEDFLAHP